MKAKLLDFLKHPTSLNVTINTIGNYLNTGFTVLLVLILARTLTRQDYGVFSVLFGIAYVLANILDFGTTATIYSYLPEALKLKREVLYSFIKSTFFYQTLFSSFVIGFLFITFPYLDKVFFKTGAPHWQLYLTAISTLFFIWQNFLTNCMFAAKKFMLANIYINVSNVIKTVIFFLLIFTHGINLGTVIVIYGIVGPVLFFIPIFIQYRHLLEHIIKTPPDKNQFRFKYTLTFFLSSQFNNLGMRMDLFLMSYFKLKDAVGDYAVAQKIILTIMTTIVSITQVLSPNFSNIKTQKEALSYMQKALLYLALPGLLFIVVAFLPDFVFNIVFTNKFEQTAALTHALSLPFLIFTVGNIPQLFLLYTVKKPRFILVASIIFFITMSAGCYILIPIKGAFGPPIAITVALIASTIALCIPAYTEYMKLAKK
jgi:O-antigen/teichoic acid export membrane protein